MTVKELKEELSKYDDNLVVEFWKLNGEFLDIKIIQVETSYLDFILDGAK